jgi:hypothetical protein
MELDSIKFNFALYYQILLVSQNFSPWNEPTFQFIRELLDPMDLNCALTLWTDLP